MLRTHPILRREQVRDTAIPVDICRYAYIIIQPDYDKVFRAEAGGITASTFPWG